MIVENNIIRNRSLPAGDWRRELAIHHAPKRPQPTEATTAIVARCEAWLKTWMELVTDPNVGRSARDGRDLHGRLMESIVQLARLHMRTGQPSLDILSQDLTGAVRGAIEKLRMNEENEK